MQVANPMHDKSIDSEDEIETGETLKRRLYDEDGDGSVSDKELFVGLFRQLCDTNNDQAVSLEELMHVLTNFGENVTSELVSEMIIVASGGRHKQITEADFLCAISGNPRDSSHESAVVDAMAKVDEVEAAFKQIDANGNGTLDKHEVARLSRTLGHTMKRAHIVDAMHAMDQHATGEVTLPMFREWWGEHHRHWTELLVLPESVIELVKQEIGPSEVIPGDPMARHTHCAIFAIPSYLY